MKRRNKALIAVLSILALLIVCSGLISLRPFIVHRCAVPEEYLTEIRAESGGVYSENIPLFAVCVTVEDYADGKVFYTIRYFPFGTVGMSYHTGDGFNLEKRLYEHHWASS